MEWVWMSTWRRSIDGTPDAETVFIGLLARKHWNMTPWLDLWVLMASWRMAADHIRKQTGSWGYIQGSTCHHEKEGRTNNLGWMLHLVYAVPGVCWTWFTLYLGYAVLGVCCTWCMQYLVYAVLGVCCTCYLLDLVYAVLGVSCGRCMLYSVYTVLGVCCTGCML